MIKLDLTKYHAYLTISEKDGKKYIFDPVRKSDFVLLPEELVRQTWIQFLHHRHKISFASLGVEKMLKIQNTTRRYDMVWYKKAQPFMLFEFKSYKKAISAESAQQVAHYNLELKVPYLILSNGMKTYAFEVNHEEEKIIPLKLLPFYND